MFSWYKYFIVSLVFSHLGFWSGSLFLIAPFPDLCLLVLLKLKLTSAPILAYPTIGQEFILDTDASQYTVGAVLSQEYDGKERVIAYMSKTMNKHELQYCTTRKERLAVVTALKHFNCNILGQKVKLRTDNSAVSWIRNLKNQTGQVFRWLQYIETYDISVSHRAGKSHGNSDALSRIPCKVCQNRNKIMVSTRRNITQIFIQRI